MESNICERLQYLSTVMTLWHKLITAAVMNFKKLKGYVLTLNLTMCFFKENNNYMYKKFEINI